MRKLFIALFIFVSLFSISARPSFAATQPSFIQKIQSSVGNSFQKLYLLLPGDKPGDAVLNQAAQASTKLQSEQVSADILVDLQNQSQSTASIKLHADGPVKMSFATNPTDYQQDLHLNAAFSMQGTTMEADANMKVTDKKVFFQLNEVPLLPYISLADLKGRWLSVDATRSAEVASTWTEEQQQQFQQANTDLLKKSKVSTAKKATKNDHAVYVLSMNIPKEALLDYLESVQKITPSSQTNPAQSAEMMRESYTKVLNNMSEIQMTVWIDRSSFYVRHIELPLTFTNAGQVNPSGVAQQTGPLAALSQIDGFKVSTIVDFDKFNEPVTFTEPAQSEDAKEVLQGLLSNMTGVKTPEADIVRPTELPTLSAAQKLQLEQFKKMNPSVAIPGLPATP